VGYFPQVGGGGGSGYYNGYHLGGGGGGVVTGSFSSGAALDTTGIAGSGSTPGYSSCPDLPSYCARGGTGGGYQQAGTNGQSGCVIFYWGQKPW
jgi:hypothetical protein